jgi:uncharacterized protein (DUF779 family)
LALAGVQVWMGGSVSHGWAYGEIAIASVRAGMGGPDSLALAIPGVQVWVGGPISRGWAYGELALADIRPGMGGPVSPALAIPGLRAGMGGSVWRGRLGRSLRLRPGLARGRWTGYTSGLPLLRG